MKYKHILLTTDFSEGSQNVNKKAMELAKLNGAKLTLLHIVEPLPGYGYAFIGSAEIEVQLVDEAKKQLAALGKKLKIKKANQSIEIGPTKVEIPRIAEELNIDLIIVGSHGHSGLGFLLGSTANAVVHNAKCDVLTIRITE